MILVFKPIVFELLLDLVIIGGAIFIRGTVFWRLFPIEAPILAPLSALVIFIGAMIEKRLQMETVHKHFTLYSSAQLNTNIQCERLKGRSGDITCCPRCDVLIILALLCWAKRGKWLSQDYRLAQPAERERERSCRAQLTTEWLLAASHSNWEHDSSARYTDTWRKGV